MCGFVGAIAKGKSGFIQKDLDVFSQLLFSNQVRGSDGTGIFYNSKKGKINTKILKSCMPSSSLVVTKEYKKALEEVYQVSSFIIGHNRAATKGKAVIENTHPFREGGIVLAHNGTLFSHNKLHNEYEVDSRAICHHMNENGYKETIKMIDGSFALVWADQKQKTLNLCRNHQRPLFILETSSSYFIVSEELLGKWILDRNNCNFPKVKVVTPSKVFSFHIDSMDVYSEEFVDLYTSNNTWNSYSKGSWGKQEYKEDTKPYRYDSLPNKTKDYSPNTARGRHFSVGDRIKFTLSTTTPSKDGQLNGFVLNYPLSPIQYRNNEMYEDFPRVIVTGDFNGLKALKEYKNLEGVIDKIEFKENVNYLILREVVEEGITNKLVLDKCEVCECTIATKAGQTEVMCEQCKEILYGGISC